MNVYRASEPPDIKAVANLSGLSSAFLDNTRRDMLMKLNEIDNLVQLGTPENVDVQTSLNEKYGALLVFIRRFENEILE